MSDNEKPMSELVFERFSLYYRSVVSMYENSRKEITDSKELSEMLGIDPSLIRRDLSLMGKIGKRGMGYSIQALKSELEVLLLKNRTWQLALVGIGYLGNAVLRYLLNNNSNYKLAKIYDRDSQKIGKLVGGKVVEDFNQPLRIDGIDVGIITVPASEAKNVADKLIESGVNSILNFAPIKLSLPGNIFYREIDLIRELDILAGMNGFFSKDNS